VRAQYKVGKKRRLGPSMPERRGVKFTANFQRKLDSIEAFLTENDAQQALGELLGRLFDTRIPKLQSVSEIRVECLARVSQSKQGLLKLDSLKARLGESVVLRELMIDDYLILYALRGSDLYLLAIKHHLQLSFDLKGHWG